MNEPKAGEERKKFVMQRSSTNTSLTGERRHSLMGEQRKSSVDLKLEDDSSTRSPPVSPRDSNSPNFSRKISITLSSSGNLASKLKFPTVPPPPLSDSNTSNSTNGNVSNNNNSNSPSSVTKERSTTASSVTMTYRHSTRSKMTSKTLHLAELTTKQLESIFENLKKFSNANKQLIVIAKSSESVTDKLSTSKAEIFKVQLQNARNSLNTSLETYNIELKKASCQNIKKVLDACRLLHGVLELSNGTICLINILKSITVESKDDQSLFKQTLTGINTSRDALSAIIEVATEYRDELDGDSILPQLNEFMKLTQNALQNMISFKSGRIISITKCYEIESSCRSIIASIHKLITSFNGRITQQMLMVAKVASSTISQFMATINDICSSTTVMCIPDLRSTILSTSKNIKKEFIFLMELTKEILAISGASSSASSSPGSSPIVSPSSSPHNHSLISDCINGSNNNNNNSSSSSNVEESIHKLQHAFNVIRVCIRDCLSVISCCTRVDLKDLSVDASLCFRPEEEDFTRSEKAVAIPEDIYPPPPPKEAEQSFDYPDDLVPDIDNIWNEPADEAGRIVYSEDGQIKTATLNYLIKHLTSAEVSDLNYAKTFITTYRSFTSPEVLLRKLILRYKVPQEHIKNKVPIQLRTLNILKQWTDIQYSDFTEETVMELRSFLDEVDSCGDYQGLISQIRSAISKKEKEKLRHNQNEIVNLSIESKSPISPSTMLFMFSEEEIAKQLTLVDFQIYQSIGPEELLNQAWSKPKYRHRAKHVLTLISRSTDVTMWVATTILLQETLKGRVRALTKFITIADHLRKINNFNSLMALIAGINMSSVYRLKFTRGGISPQTQEIFNNLLEIMDPTQSYSNYRISLKSSNPPCIPFLGTYLTDITFIEDGNPDYLKGLINFRKREFVYNAIREIQQFQQTKYPFECVDNIFLFLSELPYIKDEERCFQLSLLREPRNATAESLL